MLPRLWADAAAVVMGEIYWLERQVENMVDGRLQGSVPLLEDMLFMLVFRVPRWYLHVR